MDQFSTDFASHWDELVGWEKRSEADTSFLLDIIQRFNCKTVLDAALGTGFHSVKLLKAGLDVTSVDISQAMIDVAQKNAKEHSVALKTLCADWAHLDQKLSEKFDCILCLGNSFACEVNSDKRQQAVMNWSNILADDGIIILDRRNYESMLKGTYNFNSKGQYFGDTVKIELEKMTESETIFSYTFSDQRKFDLKMFPVLDSQLKEMFLNAGMMPAEVFGDRKLAHSSKDVSFYFYVFRRINDE